MSRMSSSAEHADVQTRVTAEITALPAGRISVRRVLEVTAVHFGMTIEDLLMRRRDRRLVHRRWVAMYVAHKLTSRSLSFIAQRMGHRDHTTVLHGIRCAKALIDAGDAETIVTVNAIVEQLLGGEHD
jgi:chromosomal replication initiator protein